MQCKSWVHSYLVRKDEDQQTLIHSVAITSKAKRAPYLSRVLDCNVEEELVKRAGDLKVRSATSSEPARRLISGFSFRVVCSEGSTERWESQLSSKLRAAFGVSETLRTARRSPDTEH